MGGGKAGGRLQEQGIIIDHADADAAAGQRDDHQQRKGAVLEETQRHHRFRRAALHLHPEERGDDGEGDDAEARGCDERAKQFAAVRPEDHAGDGGSQEDRTEIIDLRLARRASVRQHQRQTGNNDDAERQIDQENRPPAEEITHRAAEDWADTARRHDGEAGIALVTGAFTRFEQIRIDGKDRYHDAAATKALQHAGSNQTIHRPCQTAGQRTKREDDDRRDHHIFPAEQIAELAIDRHDRAGRQQIGRADPAETLQRAEFTDDGGQCR